MRTNDYMSPYWEDTYNPSGFWSSPELDDEPSRGAANQKLVRSTFLVVSALFTAASVALLTVALMQPSGAGHHHRPHHSTPSHNHPAEVRDGSMGMLAVRKAALAITRPTIGAHRVPVGAHRSNRMVLMPRHNTSKANSEAAVRVQPPPLRHKHIKTEIRAEIHCFYNNKAPKQPLPYTVNDIPVGLCTSVIYCCLGPTSNGANLTFLNVEPETGSADLEAFSSVLHRMDPSIQRHIAVGGPHLSYPNMLRALRDFNSRAQFAKSVMRWLQLPRFSTFGLVLHVLQPEKLSRPRLLEALVLELSSRLKSRMFMVTLPLSVDVERKYFQPLTYKKVDMFIKMSHRFGRPSIGNCPNPVRGLRDHSLQKVFREVKERYQESWDRELKDKTLFTVSLAGYIYWLRNGSLTGLTHGRVEKHALSGYWDICRKVDDASWNHKYIRETGCLTAWSGRSYVSSLSPKSFKFLDGKREMKGVVVFDIEKDDFKGMCGDPYPMLRALRESLTHHKET